ncbi:MAG: ATP-binding protein [Promethearchaeota archaeon]
MERSNETFGESFGKLAGGSMEELLLITQNRDISLGEFFLIPSKRGENERIFIFRVLDAQNIMRSVTNLSRLAGTLVTEGRSYFADSDREKLLGVFGKLLGYSEKKGDNWTFMLPRRLPEHLATVYRPTEETDALMEKLLGSQVDGSLYVGNLQAGSRSLNIDVRLPLHFMPMHMGIFGTTGSGKSNLVEVLLKSCIDLNMKVIQEGKGRRLSMLAIDPHDEFALGIDTHGIQDIVDSLDVEARRAIIGDFYYLTPYLGAAARRIRPYTRAIRILWKEITPQDILSVRRFEPQQVDFLSVAHNKWGQEWINETLKQEGPVLGHREITVRAVQRRLRFMERSSIFTSEGESVLGDLIEALEGGHPVIVNTSLLSDIEQFLFTTVVSRTLFDLRRALKSSTNWSEFSKQAEMRLPPSFFSSFKSKAKKFYVKGRSGETSVIKDPADLPVVLVTVEEAPSILNPELMRGESVFKSIARQGRKFQIGLIVISQQVSAIDSVILSQMNTEINLKLGNEDEIRAAVKNASTNISGFEKEFKAMDRGEALLTASYRKMPLPIKIPKFDDLFKKDSKTYASGSL